MLFQWHIVIHPPLLVVDGYMYSNIPTNPILRNVPIVSSLNTEKQTKRPTPDSTYLNAPPLSLRASSVGRVGGLTSDNTHLSVPPLSPRSSSLGRVGKTRTSSPRPLQVEDCLNSMLAFVKAHDLSRIIGEDLTDKQLRQQLLPQAEIAAQLPINLTYVYRELVMNLAILGLYDLVVLIGESPC